MSDDPYNLERFVKAQEDCFPYKKVVEELRRGRKKEHWMWFVFPVLRGIGKSEKAKTYWIRSLDEARSYWSHPVLGPRLRECVELVVAAPGTAREILQSGTDNWKFHNCLTLFVKAVGDEPLFQTALDRFYEGECCSDTIELLKKQERDEQP